MTANSLLQITLYVMALLALAKPLGSYMARVYEGESVGLNRWLAPVEGLIYRLCGVSAKQEMRWTDYAIALLLFNLFGALAVFLLQRFQMVEHICDNDLKILDVVESCIDMQFADGRFGNIHSRDRCGAAFCGVQRKPAFVGKTIQHAFASHVPFDGLSVFALV